MRSSGTSYMPRQKKTTACPLGVMSIGGKWKLLIVSHLLSGTKRFGELQRLIPGASRQMLTMQLRELEQMGLLHRQDYEQMPPKVEYSLTELGHSFEPVLHQMLEWWECYKKQMGLA
jgi:DNA-binding HxlR family transcriptional regulator